MRPSLPAPSAPSAASSVRAEIDFQPLYFSSAIFPQEALGIHEDYYDDYRPAWRPTPPVQLARPTTPECEQQYRAALQQSRNQQWDAYRETCKAMDEAKEQWFAHLLSLPVERREFVAQKVARRVETLHGKPGQSRYAATLCHAFSQHADAPVLMASQTKALDRGVQLLNLSELQGAPARLYCSTTKSTAEQRQNFRERPTRLVALLHTLGIDDPQLTDVVTDFHVDEPKERPPATQWLDISERAAAMLAPRPSRASLSPARVAGILRSDGERGLFEVGLTRIAANAIEQGHVTLSDESA